MISKPCSIIRCVNTQWNLWYKDFIRQSLYFFLVDNHLILSAQGSKFMLANSQNASWNSVLRVENKGTRKKLRVRYFILYRIPILVSKIFQQVYSKGSGKVKAPRNTDSLSCHVTAMADKIMYFFKRRKEECGRQQVLCQLRGVRWTKFQPQEAIAIPHRNVKNCSKVGKTNCELDTAICKFKLKPLAKVCEWLKK